MKIKGLKGLWVIVFLILAVASILFITDEPISVENIVTKTSPPAQEVKGTSTVGWYEVYFTKPIIPFNKVYEGGIENELIEKINVSQTSIYVAVFEFDIETVAQALIDAKERGVDVKIVYDNENTDTDPQMQEMKNAGISTVADDRSAFMHNKFFIFDNKCIWTGSFNISMNAAYRNNENAIYFCSEEVAKNYTSEFNEMFNGSFGPGSSSNTPYPTFSINEVLVKNYFAPEDDVMEKVIDTIGSSKESIHFMAFSFTDEELAKEMISRSTSGVIVEGIFETSGADTDYSQCKTLLGKGMDIRLDGNPRTFHHKVIIIDNRIVILGSFNFSRNADTNNDENLLIVYDTNLAHEYELEYQVMKQQAFVPLGNSCTK